MGSASLLYHGKFQYLCANWLRRMDVAFLIKEYFKGVEDAISIDAFDSITLNVVYTRVLKLLTSHFEIETSVLQSLSYCFYEILDNVHIHSGKPLGIAITHFDAAKNILRILIADDGMGIQASLSENERYQNVSEAEAIRLCLMDTVTDGKGMGFCLFATSRLMNEIGHKFVIHSGHHKLIDVGGDIKIEENGLWQGTIVYMEISTDIDVNPNGIVENRSDIEAEFNEPFLETDELSKLW